MGMRWRAFEGVFGGFGVVEVGAAGFSAAARREWVGWKLGEVRISGWLVKSERVVRDWGLTIQTIEKGLV